MGRFRSGFGPNRFHSSRRRFMLAAGTSFMFILFGLVAVFVFIQNTEARRNIVDSDSVRDELSFGNVVLVAPLEQIPRGKKITSAYVKEVHWPRDQVPSDDAVRSIDEVEGMFSLVTLVANQPILKSNLSANSPTFGITELLPPGHRAVTIEVDSESRVEGWATPGVHADVILTYVSQKDGIQKTVLAVEDAIVLSSGGSAKKVIEDEVEPAKTATTVTLAVPFRDALKIENARAVGRITLVLRNSNEIASQGNGVYGSDEWGGNEQTKPKKKENVPKGFIRYPDSNGVEQQFFIGDDNKWYKDHGGEE